PVRQSDGDGCAGPDSSSTDQPTQGRRKNGDPGRLARCSAACPGRERLERQAHNEGNYAGTVLGARGIGPAFIPSVLIKTSPGSRRRRRSEVLPALRSRLE